MKFDFKTVCRILVLAVAILIALFLILKAPAQTSEQIISQLSRDVVLFVCSTVVSWTISAWFARKESSEKIDAIAERSFEKMAMLTLQVERIKKFLVDTIKLSQSEADRHGAETGLIAYKHRINGSISSLDQISASNDTFAADWLGVVSNEMKSELNSKSKELAKIPEIVAELSTADTDSTNEDEFDRSVRNVSREVSGAGRLISELKRTPKQRVALISQTPIGAQTSTNQAGRMTVDVQRPSYRATASGSFTPPMACKPSVSIELVSLPKGVNESEIVFPVGVGTEFDFNIMLASSLRGTELAVGQYVFSYEAVCDPNSVDAA